MTISTETLAAISVYLLVGVIIDINTGGFEGWREDWRDEPGNGFDKALTLLLSLSISFGVAVLWPAILVCAYFGRAIDEYDPSDDL